VKRPPAWLLVMALLGACRPAAPGVTSPPRADEGWHEIGVFAGPSAEAALLGMLTVDFDRTVGTSGRTKCLSYGEGMPVGEPDLAFVRSRSPNVHNLDRCTWRDGALVVDAQTGAPAAIMHARQRTRVGADSAVVDGGWQIGNLGGQGRDYRVTRRREGWLIEHGSSMTVS
jgi:hypothetical protein